MAKRARIVIVALAMSLLISAPVAAISGSLTPSTQSHGHGVASNWTGSWGTHPTYDVHFCYVTGTSECASWLLNTNLVTKNWSHSFYPCSTTQFTQGMYVYEDPTGVDELLTSKATESGGTPC